MGLHVLAWVGPKAQGPHGTPGGGDTLARRLVGVRMVHLGVSLGYPPRMAPPDARGPLEVLVGIVLGELDSSTPRVSG